MEYSIYYFDSNINTKIFDFVKYDKIIKIRLTYQTYTEPNTDDGPDMYEFNISIEELKSCKKLYEYYILSLFLSKDIRQNKYNNKLRIEFQEHWESVGRHMYITDYNSVSECSIPDKKLFDIDEEQTNYCKDFIETQEYDVCDYLSKYLETNLEKVIKKMEEELFTIEKDIYKQKKLLLFSSKIKRFVNDDSLININKFLMV